MRENQEVLAIILVSITVLAIITIIIIIHFSGITHDMYWPLKAIAITLNSFDECMSGLNMVVFAFLPFYPLTDVSSRPPLDFVVY